MNTRIDVDFALGRKVVPIIVNRRYRKSPSPTPETLGYNDYGHYHLRESGRRVLPESIVDIVQAGGSLLLYLDGRYHFFQVRKEEHKTWH